MSVRIVIADDHPVVRDGLRLTIDQSGKAIVIVGEASDGLQTLDIAQTKRAEIYILDITMPNMNGIETARELLRRFPEAKVIILTLHDTRAVVEEALTAGARGFLTKEMATRNVVDAVTEVHAGRYYLSSSIAHYVVESGHLGNNRLQRPGNAVAALTGQERKVLQLVAEGRSNKEIADVLNLSVHTVHAHRNRVMAKLNIHKQAELIRYAIKADIAKL
jgi:two-component system, NarL family, response regulator NreC